MLGKRDPRRMLPQVSRILDEPECQRLIVEYTRSMALDAVNDVLARLRKDLVPGDTPPDAQGIVALAETALLESTHERIRPVVNASGIILHTGLGRAVLPGCAAEALSKLDRCCNLQMDLETGRRGKRTYMTERLLTKLTGAEAVLVVNNNAAATLLVLAALSPGKEVIVSRGQLIEIGGSYRLPDCVHQSGATLVEVGTTNKTHLADYERAFTENTGMILRVNPSNYRIIGFSKQVSIADLVSLKKKYPVLVCDDLGCGALVDLSQFGLPKEPTVQESIASGADLAFFSGDKLIGGPQSGIIVGRKELIDRIRKHPLTRMLRICKLTDTALEQTLRMFLDPETLGERHPTFRMLSVSTDALREKAVSMKRELEGTLATLTVMVTPGESETGGGSMPGTPIPTFALAVTSIKHAPDRVSFLLRRHEPPVVARIADDAVMLDMRTLLDGEDDIVIDALRALDSM